MTSEGGGAGGGWEAWAAVGSRVALGLVFAWFGVHELLQPHLWTGYVPFLRPSAGLATVAVLAHGAVLLVLSVSLVFGVAPRLAAGIAAILMLEIVVSLAIPGLNDIVARDFGVLGLAVAVSSQPRQRLVLTR
jgi:uncharacterized membrane protein YphA (DoxX/SURF4 family)